MALEDIAERMQNFLLDKKKETDISFGTTLDRELLPLKTPHTRAGNKLALRGIPDLAPGSYDNAEVSSFVHMLNQKPVCKKGYSLGARTGVRFPCKNNPDFPGPPQYQPINSKPKTFSPAEKPFQCGATRFPRLQKEAVPGPGSYEHNVTRNRSVKFHGSFGGPQTLRTSITTICTNGIKDTCMICTKIPIGDYYRNIKAEALCRPCYSDLVSKQDFKKGNKKLLSKFLKVRDCCDIHTHEGTNAKMRLKSEKDIKKQRFREAYLSLYY